MFGQNFLRKQDLSTKYHLRVQDIFPTIQGEGPFSGIPAIFIRLAGCNLACTFCDTDFESRYDNIAAVPEIMKECSRIREEQKISVVVITGGEPLLQNILDLIDGLLNTVKIAHVQIETAGTVWLPGLEAYITEGRVSLVCSPKTPKVNPNIIRYCREYKYIIQDGATHPTDGLPYQNTQQQAPAPALIFRPDLQKNDAQIWVQPCDEGDTQQTRDNQQATARIAMKFGYRLSFQIHKALNLP